MRVLFQILVWVALGAHVAAWYVLGCRAVGTVAPSGLFYLVQTGLLNAGVLLAGTALMSVPLLGNAFCGWACHFGALQDLAAWLFRKAGLRTLLPEASVRLRAVLLVKLLAVNAVLTWLAVRRLPRLRFDCGAPEPLFAIGTAATVLMDVAVLAFLLCWLFGPRAFCRMLCPVILILRPGNRLARVGMALRGSCSGCGACDRACPMGNAVSRDLLEGGAVAALDCVRCGRCRDACPAGAIACGRIRPRASGPPRLPSGRWALAVGGLLGLVGYEALYQAKSGRMLEAAIFDHLPNWEFFYAALGVALGAAVRAMTRRGGSACARS